VRGFEAYRKTLTPHLRTQHNARNRRQIAHETKLKVAVEYLVPQFGRSANTQCVTVRRRPNDGFGPNVASGSWPVLDNERTPELFSERFSNQASVEIIRSAGGKANNQAH
jgi:hypothetical protein